MGDGAVAVRYIKSTVPGCRSNSDSVQCLLLIVLFCSVYLQAAISEYVFGVTRLGNLPGDSNLSRLIVETLVIVNFAWAACTRRLRFPVGSGWFMAFVAWATLSALVTQGASDWYVGLRYSRYTLYALLLYAVAGNCHFSSRQLLLIRRVITFLFVLQLIATLYKLFILGNRAEWRVGTITLGGGILATIFPLVAMGACMGYYFYIRPSWWSMLLGYGFGIIGFASGKRAIYFIMPAFFAINLLLFNALERRRVTASSNRRLVWHILGCSLLVLPASLSAMRNSGLGHSAEHASSLREFIGAAVDYAGEYDTGWSRHGGATGRTSASLTVIGNLGTAPATEVLFGLGPSSFYGGPQRPNGTGAFRAFDISYGIVGWSHTSISIGLPGVLFLMLGYGSALISLFRRVRSHVFVPYRGWTAFAGLSGGGALLYEYFFYGSSLTGIGAISFFVLFAVGLAASPLSSFAAQSPGPGRCRNMSAPIRPLLHQARGCPTELRQMIR